MRRLPLLLCAALSLPASAAASTDPCPGPAAEPPAQATRERALAVVEQALSATDARVMTMAAGWWRVVARADGKSAESDVARMLARAADVAGPDAVAWALIARACGSGCALEPPPLERWVALDADNGHAWTQAVDRALAAGDDATARTALARAALAPRFDTYWVPAVNAAIAASRAVPVPPALAMYAASQGFAPEDAADLEGLGMSFAHDMPGLGRLGEACATNAAWQDDCLRLARTMEVAGDSWLVQQVGRMLQRRLLPVESTDAHALAARQRTHDWQVHQITLRMADPAELPRALRRLRETGSEAGAFRLQLREAGIPLEPPPGWTSADARAESAKRRPPAVPEATPGCDASPPSSNP